MIDDGHYRILSFGVSDEQSVQLKSKPHILQHAYTQAMMVSLLFCQPKRVVLLGLGAGSVLSALHYMVGGVKIEAVDNRQSVINIAKKYFRLPTSKNISLHCSDAKDFIAQRSAKKVDLIMTDLYSDLGMDESQISQSYLRDCAGQLKVNGWLVINCWGIADQHSELFRQLKPLYADVRHCESGDGNIIIFAGKQKCLLSHSALRDLASDYATSLEFDLQRYLEACRA